MGRDKKKTCDEKLRHMVPRIKLSLQSIPLWQYWDANVKRKLVNT